MTKRRIILISIASILAAIFVIQILLGLRSPQKRFKIKEQADFISIQNSGETVTVQKIGEDWFCADKKADASKIEQLVEKFSDIKTLSLASSSADQNLLERYGLENPIIVRAKSGDKDLRAVLIGKESVSGSQVYIQFEGKEEIYLAQGNLRRDFTFKLENILEKEKVEESASADANTDNADAESNTESNPEEEAIEITH